MLARVFPRPTKATPSDSLAFVGPPDLFARQHDITEVHVSVAFTWDIPIAERLAKQWERIAPTRVGGPAYGQPGVEFIAGRYLGEGYTITSRGCPRKCWFCRVPKTEGTLRELPITDGWKVQDDNLLACSRRHFEAVVSMLRRQHCQVEFTGGLVAAMLQDWHVDALCSLKPQPVCFFAFDPGDEYETLAIAARKMREAGFSIAGHRLRCYVLIGHPGDTLDEAEKRLVSMLNLGFTPFSMLWRHPTKHVASDEWKRFQRSWSRPAAIHARQRSSTSK